MILHAGIMLQDRYEILEKIGSGGMSCLLYTSNAADE